MIQVVLVTSLDFCILSPSPFTSGRTLKLIHEQMRGGAVYQVVPFGGRLVVSVNSQVSVCTWSEESLSLTEECKYTNNILSLYVKTKGDFILVGAHTHTHTHTHTRMHTHAAHTHTQTHQYTLTMYAGTYPMYAHTCPPYMHVHTHTHTHYHRWETSYGQ